MRTTYPWTPTSGSPSGTLSASSTTQSPTKTRSTSLNELDRQSLTAALDQINRASGQNFATPGDFAAWIESIQLADDPTLNEACHILGVDVSEFLRTRQPFLTIEQIKSFQVVGFTIGAHTINHSNLNLLTQEEQAAEIVESCRIVHDFTGENQTPLAFPFSSDKVDHDFLADLRARHTFIGLIFDAKNSDKTAISFSTAFRLINLPQALPPKKISATTYMRPTDET